MTTLPDLWYEELIQHPFTPTLPGVEEEAEEEYDATTLKILRGLPGGKAKFPKNGGGSQKINWTTARAGIDHTQVVAYREYVVEELDGRRATEVCMQGGHRLLLVVTLEQFVQDRVRVLSFMQNFPVRELLLTPNLN